MSDAHIHTHIYISKIKIYLKCD